MTSCSSSESVGSWPVGGTKRERMPVRSPKAAICEASAGTRPWSSSAVGRSSRARCSSSSIACVASALVSASSATQVRRRVGHRRLEPQQDPGQRLVDLVVEVLGDPRALLLLGAQHGAAGLAALVLEPAHHAVEVRRVRRWTSLEAPRETSARVPGDARSTVAHRLDELAHRLQPAAQQQRVEQHDREHGEADQQQPLRADRVVEPLARDDRRDERGDGDEHGVDREHLGEQRALAHSSHVIGTTADIR